MKTYTEDELKEILKNHSIWVKTDGKKGSKAELSNSNLSGINLNYADLCNADLYHVDLNYANLALTDLSYANLSNADLRNANLSNANLSGANLSGANLSNTDLSNANLNGSNLSGANLSGAFLSGADLRNILRTEYTAFYDLCCPEKGSFIGYTNIKHYIIELQITEDAERSSGTSRKCRCSKAKVLSITNLDGSDSGVNEISSKNDSHFIYRIGQIVEVKNFDKNSWNNHTNDIQFFITRNEAVKC